MQKRKKTTSSVRFFARRGTNVKETFVIGSASKERCSILKVKTRKRTLERGRVVNCQMMRANTKKSHHLPPDQPHRFSYVSDSFHYTLQEILANIQELQRQLWEHKNKEDQREENVSLCRRGAQEDGEKEAALRFLKPPASPHRVFAAIKSSVKPAHPAPTKHNNRTTTSR